MSTQYGMLKKWIALGIEFAFQRESEIAFSKMWKSVCSIDTNGLQKMRQLKFTRSMDVASCVAQRMKEKTQSPIFAICPNWNCNSNLLYCVGASATLHHMRCKWWSVQKLHRAVCNSCNIAIVGVIAVLTVSTKIEFDNNRWKTRVRRRETKTPAANGYFAFCNYGNDEARKRKGYKFIWIRCVKLVSQIHINGSALEKCFGCIRPFLNCGSISLSRACMRFKLCMCKCGFHRDFLVALSVLGPLFIILLWLMPLPLPLPPLLYRCVPFLLFTYLRLIHL